MLVLSRCRDESIIIGEEDKQIIITVVDIRPDRVRLGIQAPPDTCVHREEVYQNIRARQQSKPDIITGATRKNPE